ncbi:MAG: Ig-like domain-containing protein [Chitinophagales bacterium]
MKKVNTAFFIYVFTFTIALLSSVSAFSQTSGNPLAQDDNITTLENQTVVIIVLNNDLGIDLNVSFVDTPSNGTALLNAGGTISYIPNINYVGMDSFTYQVSDDVGATSEATVMVDVLDDVSNNVVTQANDDEYFSIINELVVADVLSNDTGEGLIITDIPQTPTNGLAGINSDNTLLYTPNVGFFGTDSFTYTITDSDGTTSTATVTIYIADPTTNNPPNIESFTICTQPITPTVICYPFSDPDGHSVSYDEEETHTTFNCSIVYLNDTCIRYTALPGFLGTDTIFAVICDDQIPAKCSTSKIIVHIGDVIHPEAQDDNVVIGAETLTINDITTNNDDAHNGAFLTILDNDYDACESDLQVINIVDNPDDGTAVLENGQILYTPDAGFVGSDMLEYVVCNDIPLCDTALVTILVEEDNGCNYDLELCLPPFQAYEICPSFCDINAEDISGINAETNVGVITDGSNAQCFYFVPPADLNETVGQATFTACNDAGDCSQTFADIFISASCGDNPPIAQDDSALVNLGENVVIYALENDVDFDGQALTITNIVEMPNCGDATIVGGSEILYTPTAFCPEGDTFLYEVCDLGGLCDTATIFVNIQNNTDCEFQTEYCTQPVQPVELCVQFCSLLGTNPTIIDAETTFNCSISLLGNNCIQYTALPGYAGTDIVTIIGENEDGQTENVEVLVHVGCIEPTALSDLAVVENHEPTMIDVLLNDVVPCEGELYPSLLESPSNGSVTINNNTLVYTPDADFVGTDTFVYNACNDCENILTPGEPVCSPATVTVQVLPDGTTTTIFDIEPDLVQTPFNMPIIIDILANDLGENITINNVTSPINGVVSIGLTNQITYTPNDGFVGFDYFFYQACNEEGECETTLVGVEVLSEGQPNLPPNTNNDVLTIGIGEQDTINVLANDSDPENADLIVGDILTPPFNGSASITADYNIIYTPNSTAEGQDSFVYTACDPQGECTEATVVINIGAEAANNPPLAIDDEESLGENGQVQIYILANDSDSDEGQEITTTLLTDPVYGELVENSDASVTYTLTTAGFEGFDYFQYIVCDNGLPVLCDTAFVLIGVGQTNIPPNAVDDVVSTTINNYIDIDVLENDSDFDDGIENVTIELVIGEEPINGILYLNGQNEFSYTPNDGFIGTDTFIYEICDPLGACNQATVIIYVTPEIIAQPDIAFTVMNESVTINVINNDVGEDIILNMVLDLPDHGSIVNADPILGTFEYLPNNNYIGTDHFIYEICDEVGNCVSTIVAINVLPIETENLAPMPNNDIATAETNETIVIFALENDSDPNNDALEIDDITVLPQNGTVDIDANGNISYVPNEDFEGCDSLTYLVCDLQAEPLCETAQVVISVGNVAGCLNFPPTAINDETQVQEGNIAEIDVLENDTDVDGEIETVILGSMPTNGEANVFDNQIVYIPNNGYVGIDHFVYIICDNGMPILCDTAFVTINVLGQDIDAEPDMATTSIQEEVEIPVLNNDNGTDINVTAIVSNPENGTVSINFQNNVITYTPDTLFFGTDYFLYQICDDITEQCDTTIVTIQVLADTITNVQPNAVNDIDSTNINQTIDIEILANDNDPFGGTTLDIEILISTTNGTLTENNDGTIEYVPNEAYAGIDSFAYEICDNGIPELCDTAIAIIFVGGENIANIAPQAIDDIAATNLEVAIEIDVLANDIDENNLSLISISEPTHGQAEIVDNIVIYTPEEGYLGTDYFTYIACDDGLPAMCDTAYVTINISQDTLKFFIEVEPNTTLQFCLDEYIVNESFVIDTIGVLSSPNDGSLIVINGCISYIPSANFQGEDSFVLEVCDINNECLLLTFCSIVGDLPQPPVAVDDNAITTINTAVEIEVTSNDFDPDGDELDSISIIIESSVVGSTFSIDVDLLTITYIPANNFVGEDSLAYTITDITGMTSDTAWVFITVDSLINVSIDTLEAFDDESTTPINTDIDIAILQNDILPDNVLSEDAIITLIQSPANGTVTAAADQQVTYSPSLDFVGEDSFIYEVCATITDGEQLCDTATVYLIIESLSDCEEEPIFASGFSPNDDGINDVFLVENIDCYAEFKPTFTIFNRWGDVVYMATNFTNQQAWNGRWQNINEGVTEGTYFYVLDLNNGKVNVRKSGFVEVRR